MEGEEPVFGDQHVGQSVAGDVDEFEVGIVPVELGQAVEALERGEIALRGARVVARLDPGKGGDIDHAVTVEGQELAADGVAMAGGVDDLAQRTEFRRDQLGLVGLLGDIGGTEVALVVPGVRRRVENARQALAVEIEPAEAGTVYALRQIAEAVAIGGADGRVELRAAVIEFERRQAPAVPALRVGAVAGLGQRGQEGVDRRLRVGRGELVGVAQVDRAHEAIGADAGVRLESC